MARASCPVLLMVQIMHSLGVQKDVMWGVRAACPSGSRLFQHSRPSVQGMSTGSKCQLPLNRGSQQPLWLLACLFSRAAADVQACDSSPIRVLLIHTIEQLQEASTDIAGDLAHHPCRHRVVPGQLCRPVVLQGISQGAAALTGLARVCLPA